MSIQAALIEIERFSKIFKAFDDVKNSMAELTSLEQNTIELTTRRDLLVDELTGKTLELEEAKRKLKSQDKVLQDKLDRQEEQLTLAAKQAQDILDASILQQTQELEDRLSLTKEDLRRNLEQNSQLQQSISEKQGILVDLDSKIKTAQNTIATIFNRTI